MIVIHQHPNLPLEEDIRKGASKLFVKLLSKIMLTLGNALLLVLIVLGLTLPIDRVLPVATVLFPFIVCLIVIGIFTSEFGWPTTIGGNIRYFQRQYLRQCIAAITAFKETGYAQQLQEINDDEKAYLQRCKEQRDKLQEEYDSADRRLEEARHMLGLL